MADNYDAYWADVGVELPVLENSQEVTSTTIKPVPELPLSSSSSFDIVAVINNKNSVRISWEGLVQNFVSSTTDIPLEPGQTSGVAYCTLAVDTAAIYSNDGNSWGKTPRYTANWGDITENTRFLLVNAPMQLTSTEVGNVWSSINLAIATDTSVGLIKGSDSVEIDEDGSLSVPQAIAKTLDVQGTVGTVRLNDVYGSTAEGDPNTYAVTENYVAGAISNFTSTYVPQTATHSRKGVVSIATDCALTIDDDTEDGVLGVRTASKTQSGTVKLARISGYDADQDAVSAASVELVNKLIGDSKSTVLGTLATTSNPGLVQLPTDGTITSDWQSESPTGTLSLQVATNNVPGIVSSMAHSIDKNADNTTSGSKAVTQKAVVDYVASEISSSRENLPVASATTLGAIRVGDGLEMDTDDPEVLNLITADESYIGGVKVEKAKSSVDPSMYTVPTVARVKELLGAAGVSIATYTDAGIIKLGSATVISDGVPVGKNSSDRLVIDKAQIRDVVDSLIPGTSIATTSKLGVVMLSSSNYGSGYSIPICGTSTGAIFVSTSDMPAATTVQDGLVRLSTTTVLSSTSHAAIGVDEYGQLRATTSSGSGGGGGTAYVATGSNALSESNSALVGTIADTLHLAVDHATASTYGVVKLGAGSVITDGVPVGVNSSGALYAMSSGGGGGGETTLLPATTTRLGGVCLTDSEDLNGKSYIPIGMDSNNFGIGIDSSMLSTTPATDTDYGTVVLGTSDTYSSDYAPVGLTDAETPGLAVHKATSDSYGVVKVSGTNIDSSDYVKVGTLIDGSLAVPTDQLSSPFKVIVKQVTGGYTISMQGGIIQMNDGTFVNVASVSDLSIGSPSTGQSLVLNVYMDTDGVAHAEFSLTDSINVVNCTPEVTLS